MKQINSKRKKIALIALVPIMVILGITQIVLAAGTVYYVRPDGNDTCTGLVDAPPAFPGDTACAKLTIQAGIDAAEDADIINVMAGTYTDPIDIDGFTGLTITGEDKNTVILQPTSLVAWNSCGHTTNRNTALRIVDSTGVLLENLTLDMDVVKANGVTGLLYCDSTGTVNNNILKNLSVDDLAGGYYEIGSDFTAPGYSKDVRAEIAITNNTFIDTGRLGVVTHWYTDATITGNIFYKTTDDFGYGIEIGGPSTATIQYNYLHGFDTPAATDDSESAGIYIENAFTSPAYTGDPISVTKNVVVENNDILNNQYGMWIGNGYDGLAGDVDIRVTLNNNIIAGNDEGGLWIQDEDMESGSSVNVTGGGNTIRNNGTYGYNIFTEGDGDINVDLTGETITSNETGVSVEDTAPGTSAYDVSVTNSCFSGNTVTGVNNAVIATIVNAVGNFWGDATGPYHPTMNPGGFGDEVSDYIDFDPWLDACASPETGNWYNVNQGTYFNTLQAALDSALPDETLQPVEDGVNGGGTVATSGIIIDLNGFTCGADSPFLTVASTDVTVTGPGTLDGGGSTDPAILIITGGDNFTMTDVEVLNWEDGIHVANDVTSINIFSNLFHDNTDTGLDVGASATIGGVQSIYENIFMLNSGFGVKNDGPGSLDATRNYWGDATGPETSAVTYSETNPHGGAAAGDAALGDVDTVPWYATDTADSSSEFVTVTHSSLIALSDTIQGGVDAALAGDTVTASAGTYVEQVEIDKALTLEGAGPTTVIQSPDILTKYFTSSTDNYPVVFIHDTDDVIVQNLTVDGAGKGNANYRFNGIAFNNASGTVDTVSIIDVRDTPFSGLQHGVALYAWNNDSVNRTVNVWDCTMTGFQKTAIALNAGATTPLTVEVLGNTITGVGATDITAQNGIQVWGELASGTVADNTISGIAYDNSASETKWVATSILNFYADLDISSNTITDAHMGIYNIDGQSTISNNDLDIVKVGVSAFGIIGSDPPKAVPAPYEAPETMGAASTDGYSIETADSLVPVYIFENTATFSGADSTDTYGIEVDAGFGPNDLSATITDNLIDGFETGIEVYKDTEETDTGIFTGVTAHDNCLINNTFGLHSNDSTIIVDAINNFWGHASGPYHPNLNPTGFGGEVSDYVDFVPWLDSCELIQTPNWLTFFPLVFYQYP